MITINGGSFKSFNFPVGEKHVIIEHTLYPNDVQIIFEFEKNEEIIELLLLANAIKERKGTISYLEIPYVPFSRQDRINTVGECFSLKVFCSLINSIEAREVCIIDPHSDVTSALLNRCIVVNQESLFYEQFKGMDVFHLVSPDGGALKKIYKLAKLVQPLSVIECSKIRNTTTGEITGVKADLDTDFDLQKQPCYIVDDICDGGKTFIEIAKVLKGHNAGKIVLMISHGFFTKGVQVFDGLIDEIYTRKGKIK